MDPLTQGLLGAAAAQSITKKNQRWQAALVGAIGGILPDLDIFIRSAQDPLLGLEYHRHFTHSLLFIPVGGLVTTLLLWFFLKKNLSFKILYLYSVIGYATHGLLDACTSYGTQLFWPFSTLRVAWNNVAVVDPAYSLILLLGLLLTFWKKRIYWVRLGLMLSIFYLLFGVIQRERAENFQKEVAQARGHTREKSMVHPTVGNLILWRSVYQAGDRYYVDALRLSLLEPSKIYEGKSVPVLHPKEHWPRIPRDSTLYRDIQRFSWFSSGWLYEPPSHPNTVADLRYSFQPQGITPLWGIAIDPSQPQKHTPFLQFQKLTLQEWDEFLRMLQGSGSFK